MCLILRLVGWYGLTGMEPHPAASTWNLCREVPPYNPIARRSIRPFLTGGHQR